MARILVNAGHRLGIDNGGHHGAQTEAATNINVAVACANKLREAGHQVDLTHLIPEAKKLRAVDLLAWANRKGVYQYCISIHQNDSENEYAEGVETLWNGVDRVARDIAESIQKELVGIGGVDRGVKERRDLAILKINKCHNVLTEGAFLTAKDYQRVNTKQEQAIQGVSIATGFLKAI